MFMITIIALWILPVIAYTPHFIVQDDKSLSPFDDAKVPVVLGVMSKCPDALVCESVFDKVLEKVVNKVDLSLTFIGKTNKSEPDFGVTCLHGPEECAGNVQQLCVAKHAPSEFWRFVQCQNYHGRANIGKPDLALKCSTITGIDWVSGPVGQCTGIDASGKGKEGVKLLQENVQTTASLGIRKSCTVLINSKQVCLHDETWKECEEGHTVKDFVRQIENEYERLNSLDDD